MPKTIYTGLDILLSDTSQLKSLGEHVAYLGHEASVTSALEPGYLALSKKIGTRLSRLFGPQHGFFTADQDNMIETDHQIHPHLKIPVYSLYSETRQPNSSMLEGLDSIVVDLQDVGTRVYTYIWTLYLIMTTCRNRSIKIVILDRPNPIGGLKIEGNLPDSEYFSFVCMSKIPMRHGLTIGEMALLFNEEFNNEVNLKVIRMKGWKRWMRWPDTGLEWVNPSPNLPTPSSALVYPGTVLIEGSVLSEGRGTTRSLETFGHPNLDPILLAETIEKELNKSGLVGYKLRPTTFRPTFDKFQGALCGGYQLHCIDDKLFEPWKLMQHFLRIIYTNSDIRPFWNTEPYEYETKELAIDYINGTARIREWIENNGTSQDLLNIEKEGLELYRSLIKNKLLYQD